MSHFLGFFHKQTAKKKMENKGTMSTRRRVTRLISWGLFTIRPVATAPRAFRPAPPSMSWLPPPLPPPLSRLKKKAFIRAVASPLASVSWEKKKQKILKVRALASGSLVPHKFSKSQSLVYLAM